MSSTPERGRTNSSPSRAKSAHTSKRLFKTLWLFNARRSLSEEAPHDRDRMLRTRRMLLIICGGLLVSSFGERAIVVSGIAASPVYVAVSLDSVAAMLLLLIGWISAVYTYLTFRVYSGPMLEALNSDLNSVLAHDPQWQEISWRTWADFLETTLENHVNKQDPDERLPLKTLTAEGAMRFLNKDLGGEDSMPETTSGASEPLRGSAVPVAEFLEYASRILSGGGVSDAKLRSGARITLIRGSPVAQVPWSGDGFRRRPACWKVTFPDGKETYVSIGESYSSGVPRLKNATDADERLWKSEYRSLLNRARFTAALNLPAWMELEFPRWSFVITALVWSLKGYAGAVAATVALVRTLG